MISKRDAVPASLTLNGEQIERCDSFKYLGCLATAKWNMAQEIRGHIEQARSVFAKMKNVLTSRNLRLDLRLRMVRCYVFPIVLYGMEGWTPDSESGEQNQRLRDVDVPSDAQNILDGSCD